MRSPPREPDRSWVHPLTVHEAHNIPLLRVASMMGLGEPVRRGHEHAVCCPLHSDHDPSLMINEEHNVWFCHPCHRGGDSIKLVTLAYDMSFQEAVRWLTDTLP